MKAIENKPRGSGEEWIVHLFDAHASAVFRLAYAELGDAHEAQDVVQDTFLIAWRKRQSIALINGSALPWLLTTARYISLARKRREARRRTDTVPPERLHELVAASDTHSDLTIDSALAELEPADRRVVELVLIDGLSYADAAEQLGLTLSATGKRLQRARNGSKHDFAPTLSSRLLFKGHNHDRLISESGHVSGRCA